MTTALWTSPGGAANTKDTVENVFIQNPAAGNWTIEVIGAEIIQDAHLETVGIIDADFALVVSGVVVPVACYPDCNLDGVLDTSDFGCFTNKFILGDMYADCNGDLILDTSDFGCFSNSFIVGCP
jgi:hypothetical protein